MCFSQTDANAAPRQPPAKVTFDTSTLSDVVDPDKYAGSADYAAYRAVHDAVKTGRVLGFFSEAVVHLGCDRPQN